MKVIQKLKNIPSSLFQQDYWSMKDKELDVIATKYNIPSMSLPPGDTNWAHAYVDRDRIIGILVARDNALRTKLTTVLSILALVLSVIAFTKSFFAASSVQR